MDQASLNHYFENSDELLDHGHGHHHHHHHHHQRSEDTDRLEERDKEIDRTNGHGEVEAEHGPLDLLLNAISDRPGQSPDQVETDQHHNRDDENETYLPYDTDGGITSHTDRDEPPLGNRDLLEPKHSNDDVESGNSIQGLLAASRMIGGDSERTRSNNARHLHHRSGGDVPFSEPTVTPPIAHRRINPNPLKRRATSPPLSDVRRAKITRMFAATIGPSGSRVPEQQMSFSTITIMHGHIAQKSYGKEKRFLCPPPVVRMTGNVSDTVETAVFKLVNEDIGNDIPVISNTQGVRLDVPDRDLNARAHLREGISFPGLYASRTGKAKGLKLRLDVYQPGGTIPREKDSESADPIETMFAQGRMEVQDNGADGMFGLTALANETSQGPAEAGPSAPPQKSVNGEIARPPDYVNRSETGSRMPGGTSTDDQVPPEIQDMIHQEQEMQTGGINDGTQKGYAYGLGNIVDRSNAAVTMVLEEDQAIPTTGLVEDFNRFQITDRPWATFEASGIQIVSKPSKQTIGVSKPSKNSRAIGIRIGDPFALWSRVSAQTVMTRYLYVDIDRGLLVGRNGDWSSWVVDVVSRGQPPPGSAPQEFAPDPDILTYGSVIILRDIHTHYRSEPLLLCKVLNGAVYLHDYGPVSELHRIAFAKTVPGQGRWFLRSPVIERVRDKRGPRPGANKKVAKRKKLRADGNEHMPDEMDNYPGDGTGGLDGVVEDNESQGIYLADIPSELEHDGRPKQSRVNSNLELEDRVNLSPALFSAPQIRLEEGEDGMEEREYLDDYLTWTISGITEHNFTFFEGRHEIGDYTTVFKLPLTPIPQIIEVPVYNAQHNTLTMAVTNYFYDDDNATFRNKPLYLYLGAIGPLRVRTYQSIAPEDNWNVVDRAPHRFPAIATDGGQDGPPENRPYSAIPRHMEHTLLVISCPDPLDMWNATTIERERYERKAQLELLSYEDMASHDQVDDTVHPPDLPPYHGPDHVRKRKKKADEDDEDGDALEDHASTPLPQVLASLPDEQHNHVSEIDEVASLQQPNGLDLSGGASNVLSAVEESNHRVLNLGDAAEPDHHEVEDRSAELQINHFQQAEFQEHDLQQPNFGPEPSEPPSGHPENEITREMMENLVRQAQMQEQEGDLGTFNGLIPFATEGFNLDDQHQIALLAAQAARSQVDTMLHNDMSFVHGVATDIGIFTARALEAAAQAAQSGSDMLDPQAILAQHQATLADATHIDAVAQAVSIRDLEEGPDLALGELTGIDLEAVDVESSTLAHHGDASSTSKKGKKANKEKKPKARKERIQKGGPKKPRAIPAIPTLAVSPLQHLEPPAVRITKRPFSGRLETQGHVPREKQLGGSSLPLLFLRQSDNTGYHTGKNLVVSQSLDNGEHSWDIHIV